MPIALQYPDVPFRSTLLLVLVSAQACAGGAAEPAAVTRDSAGIRITESARPAWTAEETRRLSAEPVLVIGRVEGGGSDLFHGILATRRLSDGRIVVVNRGTSELRFFDGTGRYLSSAGGEGEGPGEFRLMSLCGFGAVTRSSSRMRRTA
jgi:hypothetical protein